MTEPTTPPSAPSVSARLWAGIQPRSVFGQVSDFPPVAKQFMWLVMLIAWPFLIAFAFVMWVGWGILWALFWPLRRHMSKKDPEAYAASQRK